MFQSSYQSGPFFQLFDPKANRDNDKVYKMATANGFHRTYDKDLKGYVLEVEDNKAQFPRDEKLELCLLQEYLHVQVWVEPAANFTLELTMSDTVKTKRRIQLSNTISKPQLKPFLTKLSSKQIQCGCWVNVCFDLNGFVTKGQKYRSLQGLYINGTYKLRRIFTTKSIGRGDGQQDIKSAEIVPRHFQFPSTVQNVIVLYESPEKVEEIDNRTNVTLQEQPKEQIRYPYQTPRSISPAKRTINKSLEQKHFLANTQNITQTVMRLKNPIQKTLSNSKASEKQPLPSKHSATKHRDYSVDKKTTNKFLKRGLVAPPIIKSNPWRPKNNREEESGGGLMSAQLKKTQRRKDVESNEKLQLKKNELSSYSDSDYFQLSQKFSTVTDPKVFRREPSSLTKPKENPIHCRNSDEEIEQAIQIENSMQQSQLRKSNRPQQQQTIPPTEQLSAKPQASEQGQNFRQHQLRKFFEQVERPFTPSVGTHQQLNESVKANANTTQIELLYDTALDCYYDFKTNTYYERKP